MFQAENSSKRPCDPAADQNSVHPATLARRPAAGAAARMDAWLRYNSGDFHGEPTLEFTQRKNRAFFGRVAFSSFRIAESCARKDVNRSHHGADQPLNVTAEAWRRRRTVDELDPVFMAGRLQCSRMKFRAVAPCRTEGNPATGHGCSTPRSCSHEVLSYAACRMQRPTETLLGASSDK